MKIIKVKSQDVRAISKSEKDHTIAFIGLEDVIVVHSENTTIVAKNNDELSLNLMDLIVSMDGPVKTKIERSDVDGN